jgi:hypothetical protein
MQTTAGHIVLSCAFKIYVLDSTTLTLLYADDIFEDSRGRFAVSRHPDTLSICYPKGRKGHVRLIHLK